MAMVQKFFYYQFITKNQQSGKKQKTIKVRMLDEGQYVILLLWASGWSSSKDLAWKLSILCSYHLVLNNLELAVS